MADCNTNPDGCYTCLSDRQLFALIAEYLCDIKGDGIPIGGAVSVSNFPAVQPVSGTVTALQGTIPWTVDGTIAATQSGVWSTGRTWDLAFAADQVDVTGSAISVTNFPASFAVTQGTSPWVVSLTSTTITGTVAVTQSGVWSVGRTWDLGFATDQVDASGSVVALDAATLLALETITVLQGTSPWVVSGTVTSTPSGTQDVNIVSSIALTANQGTSPWVTNDPGLPDVLGQAAMAGSTSVTIASDQSSVPVTVGNFPATQPVSGTVTANQGTSPWVTNDPGLPNTLGQSNMAGSTSVTLASDQTAIPISGSITADIQGDYTDDSAFTVAVDKGLAIGGVFTTDSVDAGDYGAFKMNAKRELFIVQDVATNLNMTATLTAETTKVIGTVNQGTSPWVTSLASTTITGTVAVTQSTSPWVVSLASTTVTGTVAVTQSTSPWVTNDPGLPDVLGQSTMAGSTSVTIASNQSSIPVAATLTAETTKVIGTVNQGTSPWVVSLASTTVTGTVAVTQSTSPWITSLASTTITSSALPTGASTLAEQQTQTASLARRFTVGPTTLAVRKSASGDNTIITPAAGNRIRLLWIAMSAPYANGAEVLAIVKFGAAGTERYRWNITEGSNFMHWQNIEGATNEALIVNLSAALNVDVNYTYEEFT